MAIAKRIFLFMIVNILVIATLSITLNLLGVRPYLSARGIDYNALLTFCFVWGMGGAFISLSLSRIMAKWMMGVKVIDPRSQGGEGQLLQLVYQIAKRAGLTTMPEVGVYDSPEVNAFATGPTKSRSLVAVSSGLLQRMNQEQVEGVLAHEVAHIANGDMVTMTLIQGVLNAFVMFISRIIAYVVSQGVKGESSRRAVHFGVVILMDILLSLLAMFVVAYFSRIREYRADAGGSRFAGREKMIGALKALKNTTQMIDPGQNAFSVLKISSRPTGLMALMSTHPPLDERIRRLERAG